MSVYLYTIIANGIVSLVSLVGILFILKKTSSVESVDSLVSFAAGIMLSTAIISILPEALEDGLLSQKLSFVLIGIVFSFFLERFVLWYHHHHENSHGIEPSAFLVLIGDSIHNFIDGIVIATSFLVHPFLGIVTTIAVMTHELPQEIADYFILIHSGFSKFKALLFNFLSALTAIIGGIIGILTLQAFKEFSPYALSLSAGIFMYIACADLIPALHHKKRTQFESLTQAGSFLIGILLIYLMTQIVA